MVNLEKLFNSAFCAIRNNPRLMLPFTLTWLPASLISLTVAIIIRNFFGTYTFTTLIEGFELNPIATLKDIFMSNANLLVFIIAVYIVSIIVGSYVSSIYPRISWQIHSKREPSLKDATDHANRRYLSVLWTSILFDTIVITLLGLAFFGLTAMVAIGGMAGVNITITIILGFIVAVIGFLAFIIFVTPTDLFLAPVVVIEGLSGIDAIRKAFNTFRSKILEIWLYIILLWVANSIYFAVAGALSNLAEMAIGNYAGIITIILMLFPATFMLLAYGLLYLEVTSVSKDENNQGPTC